MKKVGRPKKVIDYKQVQGFAELFCTQEDIANQLNLSVKTLQRDEQFSLVYKKGLEEAKTSLRRFQYASASRGSVPMQIWLGKNYLYQKEPKLEIEESVIDLKEASDLFLNNVEVRK